MKLKRKWDREELLMMIAERYPNYDPIIELIDIGLEAREGGDAALAVQCHKEVAGYAHLKPKGIDVAVAPSEDKPIIFKTDYGLGDVVH